MSRLEKHAFDIERELLENIAFIKATCNGEKAEPPSTLNNSKSNLEDNLDILKDMGIDFGNL